jgi:methionyl-tRNA formyltransferase
MDKKDLRIVYMGTPEFALIILFSVRNYITVSG